MRKYPIKILDKDFKILSYSYNTRGSRMKYLVVDCNYDKAFFKYENANYNVSESCSEKMCYEIAKVLDYKCARIELAKDKKGNLGILNYLFVKDDIEATKIILINNFGELELETTLKNNSNEEINGFFIQIDFLDENGNTLTSISNNSQDVIDAKGELIMRNTISGLESDINIKSAKISYFEKNTVQENIENSMTEIEDSVEE